MRKIIFLTLGFFIGGFVVCVTFYASEVLAGERDTVAVGLYRNGYTGTKVAVCLNNIDDCIIDYIVGNEPAFRGAFSPKIPLELYELKNPLKKYVNGKINPAFVSLYSPSEIRM